MMRSTHPEPSPDRNSAHGKKVWAIPSPRRETLVPALPRCHIRVRRFVSLLQSFSPFSLHVPHVLDPPLHSRHFMGQVEVVSKSRSSPQQLRPPQPLITDQVHILQLFHVAISQL